MADECKADGEVIDVAQETLVMAFELFDAELARSPERLVAVLKSEKVAKAIEEALRQEAARLLEEQKKGAPPTDGAKVIQKVGEKALAVGKDELIKAITSGAQFKQLKAQLEKLKCSFEKSPVGVWVEEHKDKWYVYVVAAGVGVAGVGAMYATWWGDELASPLTKLAEKQLRFKPMGNLEVGANKVTFVPSKRVVGVQAFATAKWERVTATLELSVTMENGKLTAAGGTGTVVVDLGQGWKFNAKGAGGVASPVPGAATAPYYSLGIGLGYTGLGGAQGLSVNILGGLAQTPDGKQTGSVGGSLDYRPKSVPGLAVSASGEGKQHFGGPSEGLFQLKVSVDL